MKVVVTTVLILFLFFGGSVYINNHVERNAEEMLVYINDLDKAIEESRWDDTSEHIKKIEKRWESTKRLWLLFMGHEEVDSVDSLTSKIMRFVEIEEREMAIGEIVLLQEVLNHLINKQALRLSNIL